MPTEPTEVPEFCHIYLLDYLIFICYSESNFLESHIQYTKYDLVFMEIGCYRTLHSVYIYIYIPLPLL